MSVLCIVMLRGLISLLLIAGLLFPPMLKLGVLLDFYQHKEYIVNTLCINRDKPQMKCNGKCHLNKQLAKTQEQDSEKNVPVPTLKTELSPSILTDNPLSYSSLFENRSFSAYRTDIYSFLQSIDFFHPPQSC